MVRNRHHTWKLFCETHRELLARTGLTSSIVHSEHRFRELLDAGYVVVSKGQASLSDLAPGEWTAVYEFAAVFFREFESYAPEDLFPAFRDEVMRRGDSFPR
jgi:hypothetical protein